MKRFLARFIVLLVAWWAHPALAYDEFVTYILGETSVTLWVYDNGPGLTYFAPHDNENTAVGVAMEAVRARGGRMAQLVHTGERNITFRYGNESYVFDPNRMFSDQGIEATLVTQGHTYSQEAHNIVRAFASSVLEFLSPSYLGGGLLVAMHNNTDGGYSADSYKPGGQFAKEASQVHRSSHWDPDDFFFVTTPRLYELLKSKDVNVVLQSEAPTDDGSLSAYCAKHGIPYVNIEAQEGHAAEQASMIAVLYGN